MKKEELKEKDKNYIANTYNRYGIFIKNGNGSIIYDYDGKKYIDFGSGIAVNIFGLNFEPWREAIINQLSDFQHTSNLYYSAPQVELAEAICHRTNMKKVFFANSGAEANEGAIKTARKYSHDKYNQDRSEIITLTNSFHGRTLLTLSATGQEHFHQNFQPFVKGFKYALANDIDCLKKLITDKTCAIMIETIQGEGGLLVLEDDYVKEIAKICMEKDILLIVDEVQTGNGRTGELYSYMHYDINPDIVTTAKGIGGGLPLGVIMFGDKVQNTLSYGDHGSTFGGNPIVTAGAKVIFDNINDELLQSVREKSKYIFSELYGSKGIKKLTGRGFMIGIEAEKDVKDIVNKCIDLGLIVLTAKDKIRLLPALNIKNSELEEGIKILKEALL